MADSVRTFWKGHMRLALVTIPIRLVTAEKASAVPRFHQIDRKSKQRIRYIKVVPGKGEVAKEDIVMGYEVEPGNYVLMEEGELDAVRLETRHTIELTQFVDLAEIDPLYFDRPYYVLPDGDVAEEGYCVIRDALKEKKKAAIGQLTLRGKENLVAVYPGGAGLVVDTLRYASEIKDADDIFSDISRSKPRADMISMAENLIQSRSEPFEPQKFKNHYAEALRDLVQTKLTKGGAVAVEETRTPGAKVLDFMEALRRSVGEDKATGKESSAAARKPARRATKSSSRSKTSKPAGRATRRRA
ncbi:MAG: Ku protein [Beijerinckiaceae bacterium]